MRIRPRYAAAAWLALGAGADLYAVRHGMSLKAFWGYLSTVITLAGYAIYICQMYPAAGEKTVKPEPISWLLFGFLTASGYVVQLAQGAAEGSWCLLITAVACFVISVWSYLRFTWSFGRTHLNTTVFAILLFGFSVFVRQHSAWATYAAVLATLADLYSYRPMLEKAWRHPHEDSVTNLAFNSVKCIPALLALQSYTMATMVYLVMLTIVNGGFAIFLLVRRAQLDAR